MMEVHTWIFVCMIIGLLIASIYAGFIEKENKKLRKENKKLKKDYQNGSATHRPASYY